MAVTKVLVVDDSLTMRALISGALERIPEVEVVGMADGAAEARAMVETLKPHVMTLDVEMPGTSGIEYLAEIMSTQPMPVIMFSTRTTEGATESIEALRLGAIDCFPKPRVAAPAELDAIIAKLGKRIKAAKGAQLKPPPAPEEDAAASRQFDWNGRLVVVGGDASSTAMLFGLFAGFPENCPPTIVVQHLGPGLTAGMVEKLNQKVAPKVVIATDGMTIEPGTIYFAPQGDAHTVVDAWPNGHLRMMARDPVAGERPSISLLFASAAKAAAGNAVGVLMLDASEDGGVGLKAMSGAGAFVFAPGEGGFSLTHNLASQPVTTAQLAPGVLKMCSK